MIWGSGFSSGAVIVILFVMLAFPTGLMFYAYFYLRSRVESLAKDKYRDQPVFLFYATLGGAVFSFVGVSLLFGILSTVPIVNVYLVLALPVGLVGWILLGIKALRQRPLYRKFLAEHPLPKLQMWMLDMYVAVFFFGFSMTLSISFKSRVQAESYEVICWALYLMFAQGLSFYAALDVCRRSENLKHPKLRVLFLLSVLIYGTFLFVLAWLAWCAWRRALWLAAADRPNPSGFTPMASPGRPTRLFMGPEGGPGV